jgi:hypothetical protein
MGYLELEYGGDMLTMVKNSGSLSSDDELDIAVEVDDGDDLLKLCAGGCGQKILVFSLESENWGEHIDGALCLECKTKQITYDDVRA